MHDVFGVHTPFVHREQQLTMVPAQKIDRSHSLFLRRMRSDIDGYHTYIGQPPQSGNDLLLNQKGLIEKNDVDMIDSV